MLVAPAAEMDAAGASAPCAAGMVAPLGARLHRREAPLMAALGWAVADAVLKPGLRASAPRMMKSIGAELAEAERSCAAGRRTHRRGPIAG